MMTKISQHKWTLISGAITAVHCGIIFGVIGFLSRRGMWHPDAIPHPPIVIAMGWIHIGNILLASGTAVVGCSVEKPQAYAAIALLLSLLSFLIAVV